MGSTKKYLDENSSARWLARLTAVVYFLAPVLGPIFRLGFMRRWYRNSWQGRAGSISALANRGEHDKAAALAIEALKEYRHAPDSTWTVSGRDVWWYFMQLAAFSVDKCGDREKREALIGLARHGVRPINGYFEALSFLTFSRWKFRERDYGAAIEFAEVAADVDETWAEPDFILGWYSQVLGWGDAMEHFARAVRKDPSIRSRIVEDPVCGRHPHIVQKLKNLPVDDGNA